MSTGPARRPSFLEILTPLAVVAGGVITWQDIHAQIGAWTGWARAFVVPTLLILGVGGALLAKRRWAILGARGLVPAGIAIVGLLIMPVVTARAGRHRDALFLADSARYLEAIATIRAAPGLPVEVPRDSLPPFVAGCCFNAEVVRRPDGSIDGFFITQMAFGPRFIGWWYHDRPELPADTTIMGDHYRPTPVTPHWARIEQ